MAVIEGVLLVSVILVLFRLFFGPTQWDRLLAYNAASNRIFVLLAVVAIFAEQPTYLDVAIVYAALSFLGVVILARFIERGGGHR